MSKYIWWYYSFQAALKNYGVADIDVFQTVDLWEKKDIAQVTCTLFALGRTVSSSIEMLNAYCIHHMQTEGFIFDNALLFCRHTSTPNSRDHGWAPSLLMNASVTSLRNSWRLARPSLVSRPVPTREPHRPARTWALVAKSCSASEYYNTTPQTQQNQITRTNPYIYWNFRNRYLFVYETFYFLNKKILGN